MEQRNIILGYAHHTSLEWTRRDTVDRARHRTEFEVLSTLGSGGFGTAYKVKNRVDSRIYAMKRVKLGSGTEGDFGINSDECAKVLREVEVLSILSSDNVVRYYGAWVEKGDYKLARTNNSGATSSEVSSQWDEGSSLSSLIAGSSSSSWDNNCNDAETRGSDHRPLPMTQQGTEVCHLCQSHYKDWEVSFEHWGLIDAVLQPFNLCTECYMKSIPSHIDASQITVRKKQVLPDFLFILLEFCECTLQEAVRNCQNDEKMIWSYFVQCVQGLAHLHSKGFIHRDVKPSNIFVHNGVIKIGDLGLATTHQYSPNENNKNSATEPVLDRNDEQKKKNESHSSQVGTLLYTAPEVSTGKYDEKCDIYSLGIVLAEIFSGFQTDMERAVVLGKLRSTGTLSTEWKSTNHEQAAELVEIMVVPDPPSRPSCSRILGKMHCMGLWERPNPVIMEDMIAEQHKHIVDLQTELENKELKISQLRQLLDEHNISHSHIV